MLHIPSNRVAACLGLGALVPFIVLASCLWLVAPVWQPSFAHALLCWGAVMLAFTGAVHCGAGVESGEDPARSWQYLYSIFPAILAWVVLLCSPGAGYFLLFAGLVAGFMVDRHVFPSWYVTLRAILTMITCASLYAAYKALQH